MNHRRQMEYNEGDALPLEGPSSQVDLYNGFAREKSNVSTTSAMDTDYKEELIKLQLRLLQEKLNKESERIERMQSYPPNVGVINEPESSAAILKRLQKATTKQKELQKKIEKEYIKIKELRSSSSHLMSASNSSSFVEPRASRESRTRDNNNTDRFDKYMEMMIINQTNSQNMIMNQLLLKSGESSKQQSPHPMMYPPYFMPPPPGGNYYPQPLPQQPMAQPLQINPSPRVLPVPTTVAPVPTDVQRIAKTSVPQSHYPFPGNDAHRKIRQLGFAALFCSLLDKSAKDHKFKPDNSFMFSVKIREVINALHRIYLSDSGAIAPILKHNLCSEEGSNFKVLVDRTLSGNTIQVAKEAAQDVSFIIENLTFQITDIMPSTGILGIHRKSGLYEMILNGQRYPDSYFYQIDLEHIQVDSERKTTNITDTEALHIIINTFLIQGLISTLLLKPREYGLTGDHSLKVQENIRIIATIYIYIYRRIITTLLAERKGISKGQKSVLMAEPRELSSFIFTDQEMDPIYKKIKKSTDYAEKILMEWAGQFVSRLRNASF